MYSDLSTIQKVIDYIEENFDREISSDEIEMICPYSYRNFQRIFFKIFNETVSGFQKRLRLESSYKKLIYTTDKISDIALQVGYFNTQSFSKAFSKQYHISPLSARKHKDDIFNKFIESSREHNISYEIKYKNPIAVYYKSIKTKDYDNVEINALWDNIGQRNRDDTFSSFGIIRDQPLITNQKHCRYDAAINKIPSRADDFQKKEIFGKKYVRFTHYGDFEGILDTYRKFYRFWLTEQPFLLDDSAVIEEYLTSENGENTTHIYFPLHL
jgi:AraC family transcriptional regulator